MNDFEHFKLRRHGDELVYQFDRMKRNDGTVAYKRRDADLWIVFDEDFGWIAKNEVTGEIGGRPWSVHPNEQTDHPPEGDWVSKKDDRSYVYQLKYE